MSKSTFISYYFSTATSPDLINWNNQADLRYVDSPPEQLYTNQIKPYHRTPQAPNVMAWL